MTDEELLALAACPPSGELAAHPMPIDAVEERLLLHRDALDGPLTTIVDCVCNRMVDIGAELTRIERHLKRLVSKELKGTGVALAQIANFLQVIALSNLGENSALLQQVFAEQLFSPPLPTDRTPYVDIPDPQPFAEAPEHGTQAADEFPPIVQTPIPAPVPSGIAPPVVPEFTPEVSAAVGGSTIPLPAPVPTEVPTSFLPGKLPGFPLESDLIVPAEEIT